MPSGLSVYGRAFKYIKKIITYRTTVRKKIHVTALRYKVKSYVRRVVKKATRTITTKTKPRETRFTFWGTSKEVRRARDVAKAEGLVPKKQFEDRLKATEFLREPERYSEYGEWEYEEERESP